MDDHESARPRLRIELVPQPLWGKSLKNTLPRARWEAIRAWALRRAGNACEICGSSTSDGKGMICHEVWDYDDTNTVQTLVGVEIHCPECDRVTHFGRTTTLRRRDLIEAALERLGRINGWQRDRVHIYTQEVREQWLARSKRQWTQDTSWYERWLADMGRF